MKILLAEDDPVACEIMTSNLKRWNYDVIATRSGKEAWEAFQKLNEPAIVVLDWEMPGISGLEVCRNIMNASSLCNMGADAEHPVHIIFVTASPSKMRATIALAAGANDYLRKPLEVQEFKSRILVAKQMLDLKIRFRETFGKDYEALDKHEQIKILI
ncbi:unnamed protein product, partial [marine sediment metagenome]